MNANAAEPKLLKLEHIPADTIPDATDFNALVDCVNALGELVEVFMGQMAEIQKEREMQAQIRNRYW